MLDLGLFAQSVMLAALNFDLGTSSLAVVAAYPKILRRILSIPESKKIAFGMAIGYPDWEHPANKFQSKREEVDNFAHWYF
jgi:nitroreductase